MSVGPSEPKQHVRPEPEGYAAERAQDLQALAKRIEQQQQHRAGPGNSEPVTKAGFRRQIAFIAVHPADDDEGHQRGAEYRGDDPLRYRRDVVSETGPAARSWTMRVRSGLACGDAIACLLQRRIEIGAQFRMCSTCHCSPQAAACGRAGGRRPDRPRAQSKRYESDAGGESSRTIRQL